METVEIEKYVEGKLDASELPDEFEIRARYRDIIRDKHQNGANMRRMKRLLECMSLFGYSVAEFERPDLHCTRIWKFSRVV